MLGFLLFLLFNGVMIVGDIDVCGNIPHEITDNMSVTCVVEEIDMRDMDP